MLHSLRNASPTCGRSHSQALPDRHNMCFYVSDTASFHLATSYSWQYLSPHSFSKIRYPCQSPTRACVSQVKGPRIAAKNLQSAMRSARPSLPNQERLRLDTVYNKFRSSREAGIGDKSAKGKGLRATLA